MESLGAAYIRAGKFREAESAFERILNRRPNSGFALLGIARANAGADENTKARQYQKEFLKAWQNADKDLPQFQESAKWLK